MIRTSPCPVVAVGSINHDVTVETPVLPRPGETVTGGALHTGLGGKDANQAIAASRARGNARMIGAVGPDGQDLLATLERAEVNITAVETLKTGHSGAAVVSVDAAGENVIVVIPGANGSLSAAAVTAAFDTIPEPAVLVLQAEIPVQVIEHAARLAVARGWRVVLNLAPYIPPAADVVAAADPLVGNEYEADALLGASGRVAADVASAAAEVGRRAAAAVITRGAAGAYAVSCGGGADDALAGGATLEDAVEAAVQAGTRAVTHRGAQLQEEGL
ncbi:PfkB family carbohydrate kinase [Streptomyces shenzhenensis]|uniref:PfkB family carbohydrate kinase n=1 Tax=Streptomyces shenzhenensis TaxID=943815 RepID=UPI003D8AE02A